MNNDELEAIRKKDFITINEAMKLTGMSERTLRRFIAAKVQSSNPEDAEYYEKVSINSDKGFRYMLKRSAIESHFKRFKETRGADEAVQSGESQLLQQTIDMLKGQLDSKDKQIDNLQNLLVAKEAVLGQLQTKMLLLEGGERKTQDGEVKKKSKFLGWLFGGG